MGMVSINSESSASNKSNGTASSVSSNIIVGTNDVCVYHTIFDWAITQTGAAWAFIITGFGIPEDAPAEMEASLRIECDPDSRRKTVFCTRYAAGTHVSYKRSLFDSQWMDSEWINCADGGNADTLDGKHASDFISPLGILENIDLNDIRYPCSFIAQTNCKNMPDSSTWGTVLVYAGGTGSVTQLYVPTVVDGAQPSMWFRHYGGTDWSSWRNTADGGVAGSVRSTNAKVRLWENSEGGNLRLTSPDGNHYVEMDIYDNSAFRMYFAENVEDNLIKAVTYDFSTKKFNINGNAATLGGISPTYFVQYLGRTTVDILNNASYEVNYIADIADSLATSVGLPTVGWYHILYMRHVNGGYGCQLVFPLNINGPVYWRHAIGTNWSSWVSLSDGGNASTVNGHSVNSNVPTNAKFTDTTYPAASASANGLVTTGAQTLAGLKTFNGGAKIGNAPAITDVVARNIRAVASANVSTVTTSNLPAGSICFVY